MTSASSLAFPGSRTLAGWWRQLSPHHPAAIAVGHLFWHRVEAAVAVNRLKSVDRFARLILEALDLETGRAATNDDLLSRLESRSHLSRAILHQLVRRLQAEGLVDLGERWLPSALGRHALRQGHYATEATERRVFHFLERCATPGDRAQPPYFVNLRGIRGTAWHANAAHSFDPVWLRQCLEQPQEWKQNRGFSVDILGMAVESSPSHESAAWQRVLVDHPEQTAAVLILAAAPAGSRLLGFAVRQEGWQLNATEPILALDRGWEELFPELITPNSQALAGAWHNWAQAHGLNEAESAACVLSLVRQRLRVQAPAAVLERLRPVRGESWLLLGEGYVRGVLQLEIV